MTPHHALSSILDNRFAGLFDEKRLAIPARRDTVIDKHYSLMYRHDFARDKEGKAVTNSYSDTVDQYRSRVKNRG